MSKIIGYHEKINKCKKESRELLLENSTLVQELSEIRQEEQHEINVSLREAINNMIVANLNIVDCNNRIIMYCNSNILLQHELNSINKRINALKKK